MKIRIANESGYGDKKVTLFATEEPDNEARLAIAFLEKWGPILAAYDGEDSTGRQKSRELTPAEIVTKSFDIAAAAMAEVRKRGLMIQLPDLNEINAEGDAEREVERESAREEKRAARARRAQTATQR